MRSKASPTKVVRSRVLPALLTFDPVDAQAGRLRDDSCLREQLGAVVLEFGQAGDETRVDRLER